MQPVLLLLLLRCLRLALQEVEVLQQCDDLLKKLGMKGSIFGSAGPGAARQPAADEDDSSSSSSTN